MIDNRESTVSAGIKLTAFIGTSDTPAKGNPCLLHRHSTPVTPSHSQNASITECHTWLHPSTKNTVIVNCYNQRQPILCCGHGLLAAASYWFQSLDTEQLTLIMHGDKITARKRQAQLWLRFERIQTKACDIPHWLSTHLLKNQRAPVSTAITSDSNGYLIVRWPDNFPLAELPRPGASLGEYTQRALIYTTKQTLLTGIDIQFRYFAPQYGQDEDLATGSAMRILADFWAPEFNTLTALQCSASKGYLMSQITDQYVEIGGYCSGNNTATPITKI